MTEQLRRPVAATLRRLATGHPCHQLTESDRLDIAETVAALTAWERIPDMPDRHAPTLTLFGDWVDEGRRRI